MKKRNLMALSFVVATVLGMGANRAVFSQEATKAVTISRDAKVAGQTLEKGSYTVRFMEGKGGELVFMRGKREVVKVSYEAAKLAAPAADNTVIYKLAGDGSVAVSRLEFKGLDTALVLK